MKTKKEKSERTRPGVLRRVHRRFPVAVFFLVGVREAYYQKKSRGSCDRFC
jgi:hypothetical protein